MKLYLVLEKDRERVSIYSISINPKSAGHILVRCRKAEEEEEEEERASYKIVKVNSEVIDLPEIMWEL